MAHRLAMQRAPLTPTAPWPAHRRRYAVMVLAHLALLPAAKSAGCHSPVHTQMRRASELGGMDDCALEATEKVPAWCTSPEVPRVELLPALGGNSRRGSVGAAGAGHSPALAKGWRQPLDPADRRLAPVLEPGARACPAVRFPLPADRGQLCVDRPLSAREHLSAQERSCELPPVDSPMTLSVPLRTASTDLTGGTGPLQGTPGARRRAQRALAWAQWVVAARHWQ